MFECLAVRVWLDSLLSNYFEGQICSFYVSNKTHLAQGGGAFRVHTVVAFYSDCSPFKSQYK